jgi:hypothetical protein
MAYIYLLQPWRQLEKGGECYTHSLGCISTFTGRFTPVLVTTNFADLLFHQPTLNSIVEYAKLSYLYSCKETVRKLTAYPNNVNHIILQMFFPMLA